MKKPVMGCVKWREGKMNKKLYLIPTFILLFGCNPIYYVEVSPDADVSSIKTVGVLKFAKGGGSVKYRNIVTVAFENAFKEMGFEVVRNEEVARVIGKTIGIERQIRHGLPLETDTFSSDTLEKIRNESGADVLLLGSIRDAYCDLSFSSDRCRVICDFQLMDTRSGKSIMEGKGFEEQTTGLAAAKQIAIKAIKKLKEKQSNQ